MQVVGWLNVGSISNLHRHWSATRWCSVKYIAVDKCHHVVDVYQAVAVDVGSFFDECAVCFVKDIVDYANHVIDVHGTAVVHVAQCVALYGKHGTYISRVIFCVVHVWEHNIFKADGVVSVGNGVANVECYVQNVAFVATESIAIGRIAEYAHKAIHRAARNAIVAIHATCCLYQHLAIRLCGNANAVGQIQVELQTGNLVLVRKRYRQYYLCILVAFDVAYGKHVVCLVAGIVVWHNSQRSALIA